ncbi:hypothetical protein MUO65_04010 [bacterium]|nr:hypothetical protein [bacterium]
MKCYIVTFAVVTLQAREKLRERLKTYPGYCPIHENCWAILTDNTAAQIVDHLKEVTQPTDRIFAVRSGTESAWVNTYGEENSQWLKKNL